jgi:preprotein translocase subunit SecB
MPEEEAVDPDATLGFGWDWRITTDDRFEVALAVQVPPTKERREYVEVSLVGVFRYGEPNAPHSLPLKNLVRENAVAMMLPFAREMVASVTGRGYYGALFLPPINVIDLMKSHAFEGSTGSKMLKDQPELSARFGMEEAKQIEAPRVPSEA